MKRKGDFFCTVLLIMAMLLLIEPVSAKTKKKVALNRKSVTLIQGKTVSLKLKHAKKKVKWCSQNRSVATVNKKGKVKALRAGRTVITAKAGRKKYTCKVTVKKVVYVSPVMQNNVFTEQDYKTFLYVIFPNGKIVLDEAEAAEVYRRFSVLKDVRRWTPEELEKAQKDAEGKTGGIFDSCSGVKISFVYQDGRVVKIRLIGNIMEMDGYYYTLSEDLSLVVWELKDKYGVALASLAG